MPLWTLRRVEPAVLVSALRALRSGVAQGWRVGGLLRHPPVLPEGVEETLRQRLSRRAQNFLWSVEHLIFANPRSPYRPLLELAGYDLGRIHQMVETQGLDGTLDRLRDDGVYVRIREFKGTEPVSRHGRTLRFQERDFANPSASAILHTRSSGSRSHGTPAAVSTEDLIESARRQRWLFDSYGLRGRDVVLWSTPRAGLYLAILLSLIGYRPQRWFSPVEDRTRSSSPLLTTAWLRSGVPLPRMEVVPPALAVEVARYISRANTSRGMLVMAFVNTALRLVLAAGAAGVPLGDVVFWTGGEPLTPVKRRQFEERGFRVLSGFGLAELGGALAVACPVGQEADDLHVLTDRVAIRQHHRPPNPGSAPVPAYLLTSLLPQARHVFLNAECGDYGALEERRCGCFLDGVGFHLHMHTIRSFEKLTAEGVTFVGPSLIRLLEETLPREFGGDSRHYQLVEGEDDRGVTRLYLLVSPQVGVVDEEGLRQFVLRELGGHHVQGRGYGRVVERIWNQADTVQVVRRDPFLTPGGKILHLHQDRAAPDFVAR